MPSCRTCLLSLLLCVCVCVCVRVCVCVCVHACVCVVCVVHTIKLCERTMRYLPNLICVIKHGRPLYVVDVVLDFVHSN